MINNKIIHCDLHPGNILHTTDNINLIDFGLCYNLSSQEVFNIKKLFKMLVQLRTWQLQLSESIAIDFILLLYPQLKRSDINADPMMMMKIKTFLMQGQLRATAQGMVVGNQNAAFGALDVIRQRLIRNGWYMN